MHLKNIFIKFENILLFILFDIFIFYLSFFLSYEIRNILDIFFPNLLIEFNIPINKLIYFYWIPIIYISSFVYEGLYTKHIDFWKHQKQLIKAIFLSTLIIFSVVSIGKLSNEISRAFIIILGMTSLGVYSFFRPKFIKFLHKKDVGLLNTIVIDETDNIDKIKLSFDKDNYAGFKILQQIDCNNFSFKDLDLDNIDAVIINETCISKENFINVYSKLIEKVSLIYIIPDMKEIPILNSELEDFNFGNLLFLRIKNNLQSKFNQLLKKVFDILLSVLILPLFLALFVVIALTIKITSPGPVLFRQQRVGKDGKPIFVYKFRTMYVDAEEKLRELINNNPDLREEWEKTRKLKNDPRITPIGRFLRKTSLDELSQIINILKGEMSFVGPRPVLQEEIDKYYKEFARFYYMVKPGITGLWQVSGRNDIDYEKRVKLDTFYVINWSLWLDIIILIKTFKTVIKKEGAY